MKDPQDDIRLTCLDRSKDYFPLGEKTISKVCTLTPCQIRDLLILEQNNVATVHLPHFFLRYNNLSPSRIIDEDSYRGSNFVSLIVLGVIIIFLGGGEGDIKYFIGFLHYW